MTSWSPLALRQYRFWSSRTFHENSLLQLIQFNWRTCMEVMHIVLCRYGRFSCCRFAPFTFGTSVPKSPLFVLIGDIFYGLHWCLWTHSLCVRQTLQFFGVPDAPTIVFWRFSNMLVVWWPVGHDMAHFDASLRDILVSVNKLPRCALFSYSSSTTFWFYQL